MVKNLILALCALATAQIASAQTFPKPPDVPAYVAVTPQYESNPAVAVRKQTPADVPPAMAYELADIASPNPSDLRRSDSSVTYCDIGVNPTPPVHNCTAPGNASLGGTGSEAKFRSHFEWTHILNDDPARFYGLPGQSHLHLFGGNLASNAYSTFPTLRNRAAKYSRAGGGGLNGTSYWMPAMVQENAFGNGKTYVAIPGTNTLYYNEEPALASQLKRLPMGLRYVSGYQVDDGGAYMQGVVNAANAASAAAGGSASRYSSSGSYYGDYSWNCVDAGGNNIVPRTVTGTGNKHIVEADGSDPWGNTCTAGMRLKMLFDAASCWDGVNLWSPGAYNHMLPRIHDNTPAFNEDVCPKNYYRLPRLQLNFEYKHSGFSQYKYWKLASDPIVGTANTGVLNGQVLRRGETFHTDWFGAWDKATVNTWNDFCIGTGGNVPHQCQDSTISATQRLIVGEANPQQGGRSPQVDITKVPTNLTAGGMYLAPATNKRTGAITMHVHGTPADPGRVIFFEGDSRTYCGTLDGSVTPCTGSYTYAAQYTGENNYAVEKNLAYPSSGIGAVEGRLATLLAAKPTTGPWVVSLFFGAVEFNALSSSYITSTYIPRVQSYVASIKAAGGKVIICTEIANRTGTAGNITSDQTNRPIYNAAVRTMLTNGQIDAVADFAADPVMGGDNSQIDFSGYWADVTHPNPAGHTRLKVIWAQAVSRAFQK